MSVLDTSTLGPVRDVPSITTTRARLVREALISIAKISDMHTSDKALAFATSPDAVLALLGRLLK